jgi:predicted dehydrogenase
MKFGILAPGNIAGKMAEAVSGIPEVERYAVASRDAERAKAFADKWNFEKAYGSYEEMLKLPELELVYVASPHSLHYTHAKTCILHGKNVLVEKPFTINAKQAEELIALAKEKGVFLAEALWTRYMPSRFMLEKLLSEKTIGEVTSLTANLGYELSGKDRLQNPELGGGALLDLGIYPINFARMVFREDVEKIQSEAVLSPRGIDWMNSITLTFGSGKMAVLHSNMLSKTDRRGMIYGTEGYLEVVNINNCEEIRVFNREDVLQQCIKVPEQINGYEYEVLSCIKALKEGITECPEMPLSETLKIMKLMDEIRAQWGMRYPCE